MSARPESRRDGTPQRRGDGSPQRRIMRSDGSLEIRRIGVRRPFLRDLYHFLRTATWPRTLWLLFATWLVLNALFAALYLAGGDVIANARPGSFADAMFFSIQTFSTIGYGGLAPVGQYANVVASAEAFVGLLFTATATGIIFAKFATPTARVLFTRDALVSNIQGKRMLHFRVANERASHIVEAHVSVSLARDEEDEAGSIFRRLYDLKLEREMSPLFALTWTVMHHVDEDSPLHGVSAEELAEQNAMLIVTIRGTDDTLAQAVHSRHAYDHEHILEGRRYVDVLRVDDEGDRFVDYRVFHEHEPM